MEAAYKAEPDDKVFVNIENSFFHCDNQNIPRYFFELIYWVYKLINIKLLVFAFKIRKTVIEKMINGHELVEFGDYVISLDAMISHLAKRHKSANLDILASYRLDILILIYDQLIFNKEIKTIKKKFCDHIDKIVVFNGRVSPERLINYLWNGEKRFVEQGIFQPNYYGDLPPVSKKRWDKELVKLGVPKPKKIACPSPKKAILFLTSPYEYQFADKDYRPRLKDFQNQYEVLISYVKICKELEIIPLIKFHPRNPKKNFLEDHCKKCFPVKFNETHRDAEKLIEDSDLIVLSTSTLAVNSALKQKPNCHCLPALYEKAAISHATKNEAELRKYMKNSFVFKDADKHALLLHGAFKELASSLMDKPTFTRYLKRALLGH